LIVKENAFVTVAEASSVTWNVTLEAPAVVGVPPITPVADKLKPAGSVPEDTHQLYGAVPPVAASVWLYAVPTVPAGSEVVVTASDAAASTIVTLRAPVRPPNVAVTVTVWFPVTAEAVRTPPEVIVAKVEFSLHVGAIAAVVPLSHVPVAVNVPVPPSFTDDGPLTAMLASDAAAALTLRLTGRVVFPVLVVVLVKVTVSV
jgi:hypothetical protein